MNEKWAYVAGIVDGEGCIGWYAHSHCRTYYGIVRVVMTHEATIRALQTMMGVGKVYPRKMDKTNRKLVWTWQVCAQADVLVLLKDILPWLITKRDKALEVIAAISAK